MAASLKLNIMARKLNNDNSNFWTGLILFLIGSVILLRKLDLPVPGWIFSWELILITIGLFLGFRYQFRGPAWFILIIIGSVSMVDNIFPAINLRKFAWPLIFIIIGLFFILRPKLVRKNPSDIPDEPIPASEEAPDFSNMDRLDITAIFAGAKRVVVSKNFRGGEIVSIFGGSEINLSKADISGKVSLETTNILGGTKLIVPHDWEIQSDMVAIFGGVEDKRDLYAMKTDPGKVLVLEGVCLFGGLEIKSY